MQERKGFSLETIQHEKLWSLEPRFSDKFSDEDIEQAWREACKKVGKFVMPEERR